MGKSESVGTSMNDLSGIFCSGALQAPKFFVRRSSAFVKTTARQVDRRYKKFKRLLLGFGEYRTRSHSAAQVPKCNTTVIPSASEGPLLRCALHKLTCVVHTALVRSLVVFATRDDRQRIVVTSIVSQFQRVGLRASGTQARGLCSIRATLKRANLRAARRNCSCRKK